jgi:hypothetical protein
MEKLTTIAIIQEILKFGQEKYIFFQKKVQEFTNSICLLMMRAKKLKRWIFIFMQT